MINSGIISTFGDKIVLNAILLFCLQLLNSPVAQTLNRNANLTASDLNLALTLTPTPNPNPKTGKILSVFCLLRRNSYRH